MDAMAIADHVAWPRIDSRIASRLVRAIVSTLCGLLAIGAVTVCERRASGALQAPLPALALVGLATVLGLAAVAFRAVVLPAGGRMHRFARYGAWGAPSLVLIAWAIGLLVPGTPAAGAIGFLGLLLLEEGWSWGRMFSTSRLADRPSGAALLETRARSALDDPADGGRMLGQPDAADEEATQWMVRRREPDGSETIEGWARADFAPGGRYAMAHVAICPPLAQTPVCYAEQADGPPANVRIGQVLPYGVRFEIKLDEPAGEPSQVTVEFSIQERQEGSS